MIEYTQISDLNFEISRVTLGTWAIGGREWGGSDERKSVDTILTAIDMGITTIDTAPIYGLGKSEEIVGKALREYGDREHVQIATKLGLEWDDKGNVRRNSSRERILYEVENSLNRLQTDYIDIYQIHWPDLQTKVEETASTMKELLDKGIIRAIGVSNHSPEQMDEFRKMAPIHTCQPPYNLFERGVEENVIPYCKEHNITLLSYSALCRGLLTGKMHKDWEFEEGDLRRDTDPKFQGEAFARHLEAVEKLKQYADDHFTKKVLHLAVRWILDKGVDSAIWGARRPGQVTFDEVFGWNLTDKQVNDIEKIVEEAVENPLEPAFMAPPE